MMGVDQGDGLPLQRLIQTKEVLLIPRYRRWMGEATALAAGTDVGMRPHPRLGRGGGLLLRQEIAQTAQQALTAARHLAAAGEAHQYLTFALSGEMYAVGILNVKEIIEYGNLTEIPMMPSFIRGVINLRGAVVPVIDMQVRFARERMNVGKKTCIIIFDSILEGEKVELGLMVDSVREVIEIPSDSIESAPQFGSSIQREFISGIGKVGGEFVVIIEPSRALNVEEMALIAERSHLD